MLRFWIEILTILIAIFVSIMVGYSNHQQEKGEQIDYTATQLNHEEREYRFQISNEREILKLKDA